MSKFHTPVPRKRINRLAEAVASGTPLMIAGRAMGLTKGQTVNTWRIIKTELGAQAV